MISLGIIAKGVVSPRQGCPPLIATPFVWGVEGDLALSKTPVMIVRVGPRRIGRPFGQGSTVMPKNKPVRTVGGVFPGNGTPLSPGAVRLVPREMPPRAVAVLLPRSRSGKKPLPL